jgi:hypothetical protein
MHDWQRQEVRVSDGLAPHDLYSFTKAAGEVLGEMYARVHGMTILCARLGWVVRSPDEVKAQLQNAWHNGILLTQDDVGRYLVACSENVLLRGDVRHQQANGALGGRLVRRASGHRLRTAGRVAAGDAVGGGVS